MAKNQFLFKHQATGIKVWMKRLDIEFPEGIGNKYYKLKYNLAEAQKNNYKTLLTFGGAYSNHIAATAWIGKKQGFKTIGIIRGEELGVDKDRTLKQNRTLAHAVKNGMVLNFISRKEYRLKNKDAYLKKLTQKFGKCYIIPEGGTNDLAVKGSAEILTENDKKFDYITCPVGTGGTLAGLINASSAHQNIVGFSALNTDLQSYIEKFTTKTNWTLCLEQRFGGFAKINKELIGFINEFKDDYGILLDPIYTGKMMYLLLEKINKGCFAENMHILAVHTGGTQGIAGMNKRLINKNLPTIKLSSK